ncbi:MAG: hypothetical protein RMJ44_09540, partial [Cytophagales bacterium]|nr:hypothetical protein [Cytophagales bacterium]
MLAFFITSCSWGREQRQIINGCSWGHEQRRGVVREDTNNGEEWFVGTGRQARSGWCGQEL